VFRRGRWLVYGRWVIMEEKARLRTELQNALRTFGVAARHQASSRIHQLLFKSELWKTSQTILLFSALPGEPRTVEILQQGVEQGKQCVYPKVDPLKVKISLFAVKSAGRLIRGSFGILEPDPRFCDVVDFDTVDLALIPGLGFDPNGNRLGRGYGYYDRFLSNPEFKGTTIGCHFHCQLSSKIPVDEHDQAVDYLLNEKGLEAAKPPVPDK